MSKNLNLALAAALLIGFGSTARAQETTQPAAANQKSEHLKVTVTGVEGLVQVRTGEDQPWQKAALGMELNEQAEFRTGPKSAVRFVIPPDQTITLDRLGTVKVLQAINQDGKIKTNLGMKYGRTRYDIEAAGQEHESTIASPSSTLAVRGTKVSLFDQRPFPAQAVSLTGRAEFRDIRKQLAFGGKNAGKTQVAVNKDTAADVSLTNSFLDPTVAMARTNSEARLVDTLISRGSTVDVDSNKNLRVIRGGVPPNDAQLSASLPGVLNFVLRWSGNADLNLGVSAFTFQPGQILYPVAGLNSIPRSGAKMPFDHRGGANGGIEICFWPKNNFDNTLYGIAVQHVSGAPAVATIDVFLNGQKVPITNFTSPPVTQIVTPVTPGGSAAAIAAVGTNLP